MTTKQGGSSPSGSGGDYVAITALVVSLVALVTAVGQLLQQYFATADGYRRCQASVMGNWAERTHLRWRWRQFRFETLYTTPEIFIAEWDSAPRDDEVLILGDTLSRQRTLAPPAMGWDDHMGSNQLAGSVMGMENGHDTKTHSRKTTVKSAKSASVASADPMQNRRDELASWLPLLHWLHEVTRASFESVEIPRPDLQGDTTADAVLVWRRYPALVMQERSWDFQPPDVSRPLAKTNVSTIAILARRMGMRWKDFRPEEGIMRAEGHSHIITSTVVRSLGVVLQYNYTGRSKRLARQSPWRAAVAGSIYKEKEEVYNSSSGADRFGAGVIRGHRRLGVPDFTLGTQQEIIASLRVLDSTEICSTTLKSIMKEDPEFRFPIADLVAMTSSMITSKGSPLVQVPAPGDNIDGITTGSLGRRIFTHTIDVYVRTKDGPVLESQKVDWPRLDIGRQTCWVLWRLKELKEKYPHEFDVQEESMDHWVVRKPIEYLHTLKAIFDETSQFLESPGHPSLSYNRLLQAHLILAVFGRDVNATREPSSRTTAASDSAKRIIADPAQIIGCYYSSLPKIVKYLQQGDRLDEKLIVDCWFTMMLRAICWGASHFFVPGERVPIAYFGSQLPVYIG
jgi:hypothetical protein